MGTGIKVDPIPTGMDAERAVLSAMMTYPDETIGVVTEIVERRDFYIDQHRLLFEAITTTYDEKGTTDSIAVRDWLEKKSLLVEAGGRELVDALLGEAGSPTSAGYHAEIVHQRAALRRMREISIEMDRRTSAGVDDVHVLADELGEMIYEAVGQKTTDMAVSVSELTSQTLENVDRRGLGELGGDVLPTGFPDLDKIIGGFRKGNLVVVAGRPSMGKTTFVLNVIARMTENPKLDGLCVMFHSLEMDRHMIHENLVCGVAGIPRKCIETGRMSDEQRRRLDAAAESIYPRSIWFDDAAPLTTMSLRSKARRHQKQHGLDLIVVDYLQLMDAAGKSENRQQEIAKMSRSLKMLARELNVCVVALSQLNRSVEARDDKRPKMSDLRESGAIEQDADLIALMYRDSYYRPGQADDRMAEVIVAKQRNGGTGVAKLAFFGEQLRFESYAETPEPIYG